jgi:hypothetical protein
MRNQPTFTTPGEIVTTPTPKPHSTFKETQAGRRETLRRRHVRALKYGA